MIAPTPVLRPAASEAWAGCRGARWRRTPRLTTLEHRLGVLGESLGQLIGGLGVDALELVKERQLFLFLLGMLDDLLTLARDVGRHHLGLGALGEEGAGRHRESRGDGARKARGEHEAGASGSAGDAGDDAEDGGESVVCPVDRARDPAAAASGARFSRPRMRSRRLGSRHRDRAGSRHLSPSPDRTPERRASVIARPCGSRAGAGRSSCRRSGACRGPDLVVLGRLARGEQAIDGATSPAGAASAEAARVGGIGTGSSSVIRASRRRRWPASARHARRISASRSGIRAAISS